MSSCFEEICDFLVFKRHESWKGFGTVNDWLKLLQKAMNKWHGPCKKFAHWLLNCWPPMRIDAWEFWFVSVEVLRRIQSVSEYQLYWKNIAKCFVFQQSAPLLVTSFPTSRGKLWRPWRSSWPLQFYCEWYWCPCKSGRKVWSWVQHGFSLQYCVYDILNLCCFCRYYCSVNLHVVFHIHIHMYLEMDDIFVSMKKL